MVATAAGSRQQQQQEEEEQLLASCLALLDIKSAEGAKSVDISPTMFRKPNAKAFELILYHAFCVTKGKGAAKKVCTGINLPPCSPCQRTMHAADNFIHAHPRISGVCGRCWTRTESRARSSTR